MYGVHSRCYGNQPQEHSGDTFDWWRCCREGKVFRAAPPPAVPQRLQRQAMMSPHTAQPEGRGPCCAYGTGLHWPVSNGSNLLIRPMTEHDQHRQKGGCLNALSEDFWPDKWDTKGDPYEKARGYRPPWVPAKLPNRWGVVKYPPPYTLYCRDRDKPINFVVKP